MSERGLWKLKKVGGEIEVKTNVKKWNCMSFKIFFDDVAGDLEWARMPKDDKSMTKIIFFYWPLQTISLFRIRKRN